MPWLIGLNAVLYIAAVAFYFSGLGVLALICVVLAVLLSLILSGGKINPFELFD